MNAPFAVGKQLAFIYPGTTSLQKQVAGKRVKEFEGHFLMEMENKPTNVMA